jgi:hypothetical protein
MSTTQACHCRRAKVENTTTIALIMVLYIKVRQDGWSRLVGERLNVGRAEFGSHATISKEERQGVACSCVRETSDVLISRRGRSNSTRCASYGGST